MLLPPGFAFLEKVSEDEAFSISRARRESDGMQVLVKVPISKYPSPKSLLALEHEYHFADKLDSNWALKPLSLERFSGGMALILENFDGVPLGSLTFPLEMGRFLAIAVQLSADISAMHDKGLIHKDLTPANVFIKGYPDACEVKLTGFAIASLLPSEEQSLHPPNLIEGTLAYMSPEQTGRMNRNLDCRSDLYSCGALFYQLITGTLACKGKDALEWVYCQVAVQPKSPSERNRAIPRILSDLILRLLAKDPEERYQTANSLQADLERCRLQWKAQGRIEPFPLGERDISERFMIQQRLYGRDTETVELLAAYERVASKGRPEFLLISGYSGVGKTSLVKELYQPILRDRAFFLAGKFDQFQRDIPYSTIVQAFRECVQQILTESPQQVEQWRAKLQAAVGINGQLIIEVIPQVSLIIGPQPPVLELPLTEDQNRFNLVFGNFVTAFAQAEHPLVLFLDDLQWADSASLKLIKTLITTPDIQYLFLIGAYRNNEVTPTHPLMLTLDELRKAGTTLRNIVLSPLSLRDLNRLIADSLHEEDECTKPLSALVYEKTGGNPFFFVQFLKTLVKESLVRFDRGKGAWTWDIQAIEALGFTDNVVDFMVEKLKKLPEATRGILMIFACAGNKIEAPILAAICQKQEIEVTRAIRAAIEEGLVQYTENTYRFLHDRIQQAAYSLLSEEEKTKIHLHIGRLLAKRDVNLEEIVFDIVSQYNLGSSLITDPNEQEQVAKLNLMSGRKAKASTAYVPALAYLSSGLSVLPEDSWEARYPLIFALQFEKAECEYLTGNFDETERLLVLLLEKAKDNLDKANIYHLMVDFYTTTDNIGQAIERGIQCLALFGIGLSPHPSREELNTAHDEVWKSLGGRSIEELLNLPLMTSKEMRIVLEILSVLKTPVLYTDLNLFGLIGCISVNISLQYGNTDASTMGYALFGSTLGSHFGDYQNGYRFGKLAYDLVEKNGYRNYKAKIAMEFGDMVNFWTHHLESDLPYLRTGFLTAVETGDLSYACFCSAHIVTLLLILGRPLEEVWLESQTKLDFVRKFRYEAAADVLVSIQRLIQNMRGLTASFSTFSDEGFDQAAFEAKVREKGPTFITCWYFTLKMQARFMSGDYEEAIAAAHVAKELVWSTVAHTQFPEFYFYYALVLAARCKKGEDLTLLLEQQALYREWAENSPENYSNRFDLITAEIARLRGEELEAEKLYEQAIKGARANGFIQNEGIANELAARFYLSRGLETIARAYLHEALYCYQRWGAKGKIRQLKRAYPQLLGKRTGFIGEGIERTEQLDLLAVIKASETISGEMSLSKQVDTLLRIAIEQAGAQRGLLLFPQSISTETSNFPCSIVNYVTRTKEKVLIDDASTPNLFSIDPYLIENRPKSILCLPIMRQAKLIALLYLENNLIAGAFTPDRISFLELVSTQSAISLENAKLYESLRESEAQFRQVIEYSPIAIVISTLTGDNLYLNKSFVETFGYTLEDIPNVQAWWLRAYPDEEYRQFAINKWNHDVEAAKLKTGKIQPSTYNVTGKDGKARIVEIIAVIIGTKLLVMINDITERKQAEDELKRLNETLEQKVLERTAQLEKANESLQQADRMKDEFLSAISHELRSPLNAITGFGSILDDEVLGPLNEQQHESLNKLLKSSDRMLSLINDLLDFAKIRAGRFEISPRETYYAPLVDEVLEGMGPLAREKNIALTAEVDVSGQVRIDPYRITQVLTNLVSNSIKFTPVGGRIQIRAFRKDNRLVTEVHDTGIGMAHSELSQLFIPFKQLEAGLAQKRGTGLGLSISKGIVEAHGGTISAESPGVGMGATFSFTLPQA